MTGDDVLTISEVATMLELTHQRVNRIAADGFITRIASGVFDRTSVERYLLERGSGRTRTWAERTAWGAVAMLSGVAPLPLGDTQTYRLRAALRGVAGPADLTARLRNRASTTTWSGHRSVTERVGKDLASPGRRRLGLVEDSTLVDGYLDARDLDALVRRHHLSPNPTGTITLRATTIDVPFIQRLISHHRTLAAVDAATSLDPRERAVGEQVLAARLDWFRDARA